MPVATPSAAYKVVVLGLSLGNPDLHLQRGSCPVEGLIWDFSSMHNTIAFSGGFKVQANNVGDLLDQFLGSGGLERLRSPRLDLMLPPHPRQRPMPEPEMVGEKT
nr:hypothetical protein [Rhodococcus sp. OK302]